MQEIQRQDKIRLNKLIDSLSLDNTTSVSLEGEPLYADKDWSTFHEFSYGLMLPSLLYLLIEKNAGTNANFDILYDELTVQNNRFNLDYFLRAIFLANENWAEFSDSKRLKTFNESEFLDRGEAFVQESIAKGLTLKINGVRELHLKEQSPIPITTPSGRPACVVLDAIYQSCKAQAGINIAFVNHSVQFRKQQERVLRILTFMHDGSLPFSNFINIFFRERNNNMQLGSIRNYKTDGSSVEVS